MSERKNVIRNSRRPKVNEQPFNSMKNSHRNYETIRKERELKEVQNSLWSK